MLKKLDEGKEIVNKPEKLFGIIQPFRKLVVLLNIYLVGLTTLWAFEFATDALSADSGHFLHIATIVTAIFAPLILLTRSVFKMYWGSRSNANQ